MNDLIKSTLIFLVGAGIGSFATYEIMKGKFLDELAAQSDMIIQNTSRDTVATNVEEAKEAADRAKEKPSIIEYHKLTQSYDKAEHMHAIEKEEQETDGPVIITPEELGDEDDYEIISLTYYEDNILTDEYDDIIENSDKILGPDALNTFGEYVDDAIYVRNDEKKVYYEVLKKASSYSEEFGTGSPEED